MDLSTTYMGMKIANPLVVSSSELTNTPDKVKACADAGAGAVVLKSLFEEQIVSGKTSLQGQDDMYFWYPEAVDFVNTFSREEGISEYLRLIEQTKKAVNIPVIASVNCVTPREWPKFAAEIEKAGADGLELNIFIPPTNINLTGYKMEETYVDIIHEVRKNISKPIAVKVGFYFTSLYRTLYKMSNLEVNSLVLFNRYYRPDIDINTMRVVAQNVFSSPHEITLSLRWIALLYNKINTELVAATGIHDYQGVIKQILAGATAVQICSTLYQNGVPYISTLLEGIAGWMKEKGYPDLASFRGLVAKNEENTAAFERVHFMKKTTGKLF
ncbi:MAG TPA: dihydroorotate dehydrogenase-like protein [Bacteroidales bacterium]|nr:dihydroorotate dehydrogenase-like protein [Bacteroidales bacterium]